MPDFNAIANEIRAAESTIRRKYICQLSERTGRNTVIYYSAWLQKSGDFPLGIDDTDMNGFMSVFKGLDRSKGLDLVLHTPGGVLSATEAIIDYFRDLFGSDIRVIVPQLAMSAGTLIALSAREIVMGCHSSLGPIDPQFGGVSAHGVIEEFNTAKKEINENPGCAELWKTIISKYRPTFIGDCQKAIKWGDELARKLLSTGMFAEVEEQKGREIIRKIIDGLADHDASKAHDRHFSAKKCAKFGLNVTYLEDDKELQDAVLSVHHAAICLVGKPDIIKLIENQNGKNHIVRLQYDSRTKP